MTRYTVNLGRARAIGRKKRARKAVSILREELERKEGDVILSQEINQEIWKDGAAKPPNKISVRVEESDGEKKAYLAEEKDKTETTSQSSETSTESEESDYSDIVSGTIDESKEEIKNLDNPDYSALLEAEKSGKDRKTLKDWIQARQE
jgi:large subunit ribosomal protein L31e